MNEPLIEYEDDAYQRAYKHVVVDVVAWASGALDFCVANIDGEG